MGLTLSYALTVTQSLSYLVTSVSEAETNMVGVERIKVWTGFFKNYSLKKKFFFFFVYIFLLSLSTIFVLGISRNQRGGTIGNAGSRSTS